MKKFLAVTFVILTALSLVSSAQASTPGQRNALGSANSYLSLTSFSRQGLIEQLKYEGFTHRQAVYGVNKAYH